MRTAPLIERRSEAFPTKNMQKSSILLLFPRISAQISTMSFSLFCRVLQMSPSSTHIAMMVISSSSLRTYMQGSVVSRVRPYCATPWPYGPWNFAFNAQDACFKLYKLFFRWQTSASRSVSTNPTGCNMYSRVERKWKTFRNCFKSPIFLLNKRKLRKLDYYGKLVRSGLWCIRVCLDRKSSTNFLPTFWFVYFNP